MGHKGAPDEVFTRPIYFR